MKQAFDNAVAGIKQVWNNFATWLNSKLSFSWDSVNIGGKEIIQAGNINLGKIPTFATGGFPEDGLFLQITEKWSGSLAMEIQRLRITAKS